MKRFPFFVMHAVAVALIGCTGNPAGDQTGNPPPFAVAKSVSVTRINSAVSQDMISEQVKSNNKFAVNMYKLLAEDGKNLFFSPYSITAALAMTAAGGAGNTRQQIRDALQVTLKGDAFDSAINAIDQSLMKHSNATDGITINVVNSTWMQAGWKFNDSYLDHLSRFYGAGVNMMDFVNQPEESRTVINTWVADRTNQKIRELLPPGTITPVTVLVLTNAIYFLADWLYSFKPEHTKQETFTLLDHSTIKAPLMQLGGPENKVTMRYARGNGVRALDFPYKGDRLAMTVLLPDEGAFGTFEDSLNSELIDRLVGALDSAELLVSLPKFKFTFGTISIVEALKALGMTDAFGSEADFSGIDGTKDLFVSDVLHKAFISVDEQGTEAAAATAVIISYKAVAPDEPVFVVNRPFIFLIRDKTTGTILFMGRILDPTATE